MQYFFYYCHAVLICVFTSVSYFNSSLPLAQKDISFIQIAEDFHIGFFALPSPSNLKMINKFF
ncbi:hypothetical protein P872_20305 [Rhodonellum psychrophilum GCM71 = DSM 17998]|uniref:Uncharacterized protein n=1 Tax=Rhodonellum psychrophilum GCM71 = DSM 17998 TaxID=1123057 RepID=U5BZ40_9BACT|nr:hypothetical protein P872_20305 [Rhodonellum psychrophilum GCM71 = DSM 17998]